MKKHPLTPLFNLGDSSGRAADRTLQLAIECNSLQFALARRSLESQAALAQQLLQAPQGLDGFLATLETLQQWQAQFAAVQKELAGAAAAYMEDLLKLGEAHKDNVIGEAQAVKAKVSAQFPAGSDAIALTLNSWIDLTARGMAQAAEQGRQLNQLTQVLTSSLPQPGKTKGNGLAA
ncbi:MAG: hypothetical protein RIR00_1022 [Pseudomonadota bacterium]|jgi:hypothetical protein